MIEEKEVMPSPRKKIQLSLWQLVVGVLSIIGVSIGLTYGVLSALPSATPITASTKLPDRLVKELASSYALMKRVYTGELDEEKLIDGALEGFVSGAGDKYTSYLNKAALKSLSETTDSSFEGIGVEIEANGDYIRIVSPIDDSPAKKAGLQPDDHIIAVDGVDIAKKTTLEVSKLVRGPKGTSVKLTIRRLGTDMEVTVVRDVIPLVSVKYQMDDAKSNVGIIRIASFSKTTYDELVAGVTALREQGAKSFVIDVRSNPGGLVDSVQQVINMFVPTDSVMFQMQNNEQGTQIIKANDKYGTFKVEEPVVVLTNGGSASASEIFASAMQDLKRAKVVGEKTFGKGTAQTVLQLSETTGIKITFSKWLTSKGEWVHERGVTPDEVVAPSAYSSYAIVDSSQIVQIKDESDAVLNIQKILRALQYPVELTGVFDEKTEQFVKQYQSDKQLAVTGVVTGDTAEQLMKDLRLLIDMNDTQLNRALKLLEE